MKQKKKKQNKKQTKKRKLKPSSEARINKYICIIRILQFLLIKINVPLYKHKKSKHTFTIRQLIILLILRQFERKSYRSFVEWLEITDR
jgi:hypothetical protein